MAVTPDKRVENARPCRPKQKVPRGHPKFAGAGPDGMMWPLRGNVDPFGPSRAGSQLVLTMSSAHHSRQTKNRAGSPEGACKGSCVSEGVDQNCQEKV